VSSSHALIIIQARMRSKRLPGKVLEMIHDTPVIEFLVNRLRQQTHLARIVVATSNDSEDDRLCDHLKKVGIEYFRGSHEDVLKRFYDCLQSHPADVMVRATADCPFIDPDVVSALISKRDQMGADYAYLSPKFAEGLDVEVMLSSALIAAHQNATLPSEREHVTLYLNNNTDRFTTTILDQEDDHSSYRFTLDTPEDLAVINAISDQFKGRCVNVSTDEIIEFLNENPKVFEINSQIIRNEGLMISLENDQNLVNETNT
jgi:spore coat polysaccharide biosynthesis protein SpsF